MRKHLQLEPEERELLDSYERDEWQSISALAEKQQQYQTYVIAALKVEGLVNIALPKEDLKAIQRKAAEAGVPYQTLIAQIVHQFVIGRLIGKPRV